MESRVFAILLSTSLVVVFITEKAASITYLFFFIFFIFILFYFILFRTHKQLQYITFTIHYS